MAPRKGKSIIQFLDDDKLLAKHFRGDSWNTWRAILKAAYALPMSDDERDLFRSVSDRDPPAHRVQQLVVIRRPASCALVRRRSCSASHAIAIRRAS